MSNPKCTLPLKVESKIQTLFDFSARVIGRTTDTQLSCFRNKVILIVNIALGDPAAAKELIQMNSMVHRFSGQLAVLAFPCNQFGSKNDFHNAEDMLNIMKYVRPGNDFEPNFILFEQVEVNGANCVPLWRFLREAIPLPTDDPLSFTASKEVTWDPVTRSDVAWNFEKFLVAPNGRLCKRFSPKFQTSALMEDIHQISNKYGIKPHVTQPY